MLKEQDLGQRMVVRRIVAVREGRPLFSDTLGDLIALDETHLTIRTRTGEVRIARADVHRAKRVPPSRQASAAQTVELELAADEAWPAPVRERLGDWILRAAQGWTGRANSALAVGDPGLPLDVAADEVRRWYAARGLPAVISVPLPAARRTDAILEQLGWSAAPTVLVQTAPLAAVRQALGGPVPARSSDGTAPDPVSPPDGHASAAVVTLDARPAEDWLEFAARREVPLPDAARHVLGAAPQVRFATIRDAAGKPIAAGRGTISGQGRWLGLTSMVVAPQWRRRGLARQVIAALATWAAEAGARDVYLQVEERNTAAVALYGELGLRTAHTYHYRREPARS